MEFGNDFTRNIVIFGVHNGSSSHTDHHKNNCLVVGEGSTEVLMKALVQQKKINTNLTEANT